MVAANTIMTEIISLLTDGLSSFASGFGSGLQDFVSNIFLQTVDSVTSLSTFGQVTIIFAGVSLAIGVCSLIFHWITSLGKRN